MCCRATAIKITLALFPQQILLSLCLFYAYFLVTSTKWGRVTAVCLSAFRQNNSKSSEWILMTLLGNVDNEPRKSSLNLGNVPEFRGSLNFDNSKMKGEDQQVIQPGWGGGLESAPPHRNTHCVVLGNELLGRSLCFLRAFLVLKWPRRQYKVWTWQSVLVRLRAGS